MKWCAVAALVGASGLAVTAATAAAPVTDPMLAPGRPAASVPVLHAGARHDSSPVVTSRTRALGSGALLTVAPTSPFTMIAPFDPPPSPWGAGHRGIDLAAAVGQPVLAPGNGVVTFAGWVVDRGVVVLGHDNGLRSSFEPVDTVVTVGERVLAGEEVGRVSASGGHCAAHSCVHWGVRAGTDYVDPLDVLAGFGPIRLLPLVPRTPRS